MIDTYLVPQTTVVTAKGDGVAVDISDAANRVLLVTLAVTAAVEQASLDLAVQGSADGKAWSDKPLLSFPQTFYLGEHSLLLDLTANAEVKLLRAHWEVNRWGRGDAAPRFELNVALREVPPEILEEAKNRLSR